VLCYGQTGAGKTFTQIGSTATYAHRGIAPRAISDVFQYVQEHPQFEASIGVSYLEIYNDTLVDLLATLPSAQAQTESLGLIEDASGGTHVKGLRVEKVKDEEAALNLLFEGETNRSIANHQLNAKSTRGHAIFTIYLQIRSRVESSDKVVRCRMNVVDLAGSERLKKTDTMGELRAESMSINRSLSYLEQVVVALASKSRTHTPYRQSKLTHLLKDAIGGNSKTLLIANIYGEMAHLEETISTLQFAARLRSVTNIASVNEQPDPQLLIKKYEREIAELKRELAMHDSLANRSRILYEPYSEMQRGALTSQLQSYLEHQTDDVPIESVRQMRELLISARTLYEQKQSELDAIRKALANGGGGVAAAGVGETDLPLPSSAEQNDAVGDEDPASKGLAIGLAPDGARPAGGLVDPPAKGTGTSGLSVEVPPNLTPTASTGAVGDVVEAPLGRSDAFSQFKLAEGKETNAKLLEAKSELKMLRTKRSSLVDAVNGAKKDIDEKKALLEHKRNEREAQGNLDEADIIDEEEYSLIQTLKEAKHSYKANHEKLVCTNSDIETAATDVDRHRQALMADFDHWYSASFLGGDDDRADPDRGAMNDPMDEDEQFEHMQMARVMAEEPESLAFTRARVAVKKKHAGKTLR